jgi:hypothetical protein
MILKVRRHSFWVLVTFLCWTTLGIRSARCQEFAPGSDEGAVIFGYTSIDYDPDTKVVTAYSETDVYDPYYYFVTTQLTSSGCGGENSSRIETTVAVQCSFQGADGNTYTAYGEHTVGFFLDSDGEYEDPDGLSYWPEYDIEQPWQFPFTSTGDGTTSDLPQTEVGETYDSAQTTIPTACGDQRDTIISEYETYGTPYYPPCDLFTQNTGDPVYTFAALNYGTYQWAVLRPYFVSDLDQLAGLTSFTITSAYRNPAKEASVAEQNGQSYHPGSRHQYGDAVDVASSSKSQWQSYQADGHQIGACVEPSNVQGGSYAHAHLDWRTNAAAEPPYSSCPRGW